MLINLVLLGVALYLASALVLYLAQRRLMYLPDPTHYTPEQAGLPHVSETFLDAPDGERLVAWTSPASRDAPTVLYFTGNAAGLANRAERIQRFISAGYGVFMPAYRGYAGSTGSPSQSALAADAVLAYDHLLALGLSPDKIVIYGESLGTGVACQTAARRRTAAVILEAPFSSMSDAAGFHYPYYPVRWLLSDTYDSLSVIGRIHAPLLIVHGARDQTVPIQLGRKLFTAAAEPKQFVTLPEAGHNDSFSFGAFEHIRRFLGERVLNAR
jgi:fermentation-respiration switch protein FrsA (DUF1100 family)